MSVKQIKKPLILGILFLLPVTFLLFLYPSTHHYETLDVVKGDVLELSNLKDEDDQSYQLENSISVLMFMGDSPEDNNIVALNLKELIYDKFKGFKGFQVLVLANPQNLNQVEELKRELHQYDELNYWHFVFGEREAISEVHQSLRQPDDFGTDVLNQYVFIVDKDRNQRGRMDDRSDQEKQKSIPVYGLYAYNGFEVAELKNKMSEDIRVLFTEYRQKRKGEFNSSSRRAEDIK